MRISAARGVPATQDAVLQEQNGGFRNEQAPLCARYLVLADYNKADEDAA
jgi:hypothetical protein